MQKLREDFTRGMSTAILLQNLLLPVSNNFTVPRIRPIMGAELGFSHLGKRTYIEDV